MRCLWCLFTECRCFGSNSKKEYVNKRDGDNNTFDGDRCGRTPRVGSIYRERSDSHRNTVKEQGGAP